LADHGSGTLLQLTSSSAFAGFRFPREVLTVAVRWHLRYGLCYRNVEELLAERGVKVSGRWTYLYRAVDRYLQMIDVMLSARRDLPAARAFFTRALAVGVTPTQADRDHVTWRGRFRPPLMDAPMTPGSPGAATRGIHRAGAGSLTGDAVAVAVKPAAVARLWSSPGQRT
jgi:transposase-like protein